MRKIISLINTYHMLIYSINLGRLTINLHSLEFVIRTFLSINDIGYEKTAKLAQNLRTLTIGQEVEENQFTNFDTLNELVEKYNNIVSSSSSYTGLKINNVFLVGLRDALAHGRAFYIEESPPYKTMLLLKFSDPQKNIPSKKPKVDFQAVMTDDWLNEKIKWTQNEYMKVVKACKIIEQKNLNKISK
jgi:molybdopterin converting factor small subunit